MQKNKKGNCMSTDKIIERTFIPASPDKIQEIRLKLES